MLAPYAITFLEEWGEDTLLVGTKENGLFRFFPRSGELEAFAPSLSGFLGKKGIQTGILLPPERSIGNAALALGTITGGVLLLDEKGELIQQVDQGNGLENDLIWDLHYDPRQGVLWVATNKGISRLDIGSRITVVPEGEGFSGRVLDLHRKAGEDEKVNPLFIATTQASYLLDQELGTPGPAPRFQEVQGTQGQCLDLLGVEGEGLLLAKEELYSVRKDGEGRWSARVEDDRYFYNMAAFPDGERFAAVRERPGLVLFEMDDGRVKEFARPMEDPIGVNSIACYETPGTDRDLIWMGSGQGVLYRVIPSADTVQGKEAWKSARVLRSDSSDGLPSGPLRVFEWKGSPLIGTLDGLYAPSSSDITDEELSFEPHELQGEVLPHDVRDILLFRSFSEGSFWVQGTGMLQRCTHREDGWHLDSLPFIRKDIGNVRAVLEDPYEDGVAWIGHDKGLARYDPSLEVKEDPEFPCLVRRVYGITGQGRGEKKRDSLLYKGSKKVASREKAIPFRRNELSFEFAAPYYQDEEGIDFRYKLEGYDENWSEWEFSVRKEYTNLHEGDYTFRVQARNLHLKRSSIGEYEFTVSPPWYRSWTAYASYGAGSIAFIFLLLRMNGRRLRAKKERLERIVEERTQEIREKKERIEEAHRDITAGLDYAQRIQEALLGSEKCIQGQFSDHFILFKPRSKVSGDFYWVREHKGHIYIAAVDCTGHGVPAAFMSILGISFLNEIMNTDELLTPGTILSRLNDRLIQELSQPEDRPMDGMDAALIRIPSFHEKGSLEARFAGANDPVYLLRKGVAGNDLKEIAGPNAPILHRSGRIKTFRYSPDGLELRGDRQQVGSADPRVREFTDIPLRLEPGDQLYLFSDGYADQFGGPKGKKFRFGPFKELLASLYERPMKEQKEALDRHFEEWKNEGDQEQIDDVLVMGIKI